jgi:GT2 family glycosyltransferase
MNVLPVGEAHLDLTIVIVNWNGGALLMRCLESIRSRVGGRVDVIVIDNDSTDGSREAAETAFPGFQILNSGSNLGFGRGNNLARGRVRTSLVLFLNPDTELLEGAVERSVACLREHPDVGALGCRMMEPDGTVQELGLQWDVTPWTALIELLFVTSSSRRYLQRWLPVADARRSGRVAKLYGGFLMVRTSVLDAAGWFDERYFMYAEDADLSRTVRRLGWQLYYCADAAIVHVGGGVTAAAPSSFTQLMQLESINKRIAKYQGSAAAALHRLVVAVGGTVRMAVLIASRVIPRSRDARAATRWNTSFVKQQQLVLWSIGRRRATVPVLRGSSMPCGSMILDAGARTASPAPGEVLR